MLPDFPPVIRQVMFPIFFGSFAKNKCIFPSLSKEEQMTGVSLLHGQAASGNLFIKSILPFLPRFIVKMIVITGTLGSMPQPKFGFFIEKSPDRFLMPRVAGAATFPRNAHFRKLALRSSTQALGTGLALKGLKRI